ncbi:Ig-like domain-containing protein [Mesoterricola silvestris]|uniref:BIG2 domain-containing protein n=1 Tax=Mesoterricola silvestris TaxID=2927979 RepID=A0AA48K920_9BACT|nr:Ig-like domain-containing protein [Mesoterricola silvestris]BDU71872.1 hypothetical protein METEAL_10460 [Mesoterricola silvestris]
MSTPRLRASFALLALMPLIWLLACSSSHKGGRDLTFLSVAPTHVALFPGETAQLGVTAHYSDGTTEAVTSGTTFEAAAPAVATISASGRITAVAAGTSTVSAHLGDKSADAVIDVAPAFFPVFTDAYPKGVTFVPFGGSTNAVAPDAAQPHAGAASLRIDVPSSGYTGGALKAAAVQNLSLYNAVTFWVKASKSATLNVAGLGNDGVNSDWSAEVANLPLTTSWVKQVIPLPDKAKLTATAGLFHFAEGSDEGAYSIWIDDIRYENLPAAELAAPTAATIAWAPTSVEISKSRSLGLTGTITYATPAVTVSNASLRWFTLASATPAVATVDGSGLVSGLTLGTSEITATLGGLAVPGSGTVTVITPIVPTTAPARPTVDPSKVISLLSKAYTNIPVDTWGTSWSNGNAGPNLTSLTIGGDDVKKYTNLAYVGVEFYAAGNAVDATSMTYLHVDVWTPDITDFHVKLVDFGANTVYGGGDDSESEVAVNATTTPALNATKQWVSLDIPMASFGNLASRRHLAQLLFIGATPSGTGTVYVDNVFFHNSPFIDSVPPTLAITDDVAAPTAYGPVTFTFTFSEDVGSSFLDSAVTVTGGTAGPLTKVSGTTYTLTVTPPATTAGTITVNVPAGTYSDLAGNAGTTAATRSQDYDTRVIMRQMDLPLVTFDAGNVAYGFTDFGGVTSSLAADPVTATNKVAKVVKPTTAQFWGGTTLSANGTLGFLHAIPFDAAHTRMTVRVYSPEAGTPVRLKVEDHANGTVACETEVNTTVANAWETLTFDFATPASGTPALDFAKTYDKASIFFNFMHGVGGTALGADATYYFDDVAFDHFTTLTFDNPALAYTLVGFGGAEDSTVATDPASSANKVVKVVKAAGAQTWAGTTFALGASNLALSRIPLGHGTTRILVRTYSPDAGAKVKLKVENAADGTLSCETDATTTVANAWETLVFDFATPSSGTAALNATTVYNKASIFFDFGNAGTGKTYYFDDVTFDAFEGPVTFDNFLATYVLTGFGGDEGATVEADPAGGSNLAAKVTKIAGAQTWAGVTVSTGANFSIGRIPFSAAGLNKFTLRVYSPAAGTPVLLKVEDQGNGTVSCEKQATTTGAGAWETLTFDFTGLFDATKTYDKVSIFPGFGAAGTGTVTYLDDLAFLP